METQKDGKHIVSLKAENVKRLKAVRIEPNGNLVVLGGNNAAGKSSVLDSIAMALGGKKLCPDEPIRKGQETAEVEVELEDLIVRRTFDATGSKLEVMSKDGRRLKSPQGVLDEMVKALTFDPLAFANGTPKDQVEILKAVTGLSERFEELDGERQEAYDQRTYVGRQVKDLEGALRTLPNHEDFDGEPESLEETLADLRAARAHNTEGEALRRRVQELKETKDRLTQEQEELLDKLSAVRTALNAKVQELEAFEWDDLDFLESKLVDMEIANKYRAENEKFHEVAEQYKAAKAEQDELTGCIAQLDMDKLQLIEDAELPIEGLGFDWDHVMFNGVPLEQISSAERLKVSVAMGIAMNPELRVMLIREGSVMDSENLQLLRELAEEHDVQLWVERVGDGPEVTVLIEDGEVVE